MILSPGLHRTKQFVVGDYYIIIINCIYNELYINSITSKCYNAHKKGLDFKNRL